MQLPAGVVVTGLAALDQLDAVGLVVAGEIRATGVTRALHEPELDLPACRCLLQVGNAQAHVVDAT